MMKPEDWHSVVNTSLDGFYNVVKPLVMPMVRGRNGGRIVTLSSLAGIAGNRGQVNYSASKAGIVGATKALALEGASKGITVNAIAPGYIDTDMVRNNPPEAQEAMKAAALLRRAAEPDEVAEMAIEGIRNDQFWILSKESKSDARLRSRTRSILDRSNPELSK